MDKYDIVHISGVAFNLTNKSKGGLYNNMKSKYGLSTHKMAGRISQREDNLYDKKIIVSILNMYMEEVRKAVLKGERVQITGVGTIIPEVKTHKKYYIPTCEDLQQDSPYTKIRLSRNDSLFQDMNQQLLQNIENGIWGLERLPFDTQQMSILKQSGFIPQDAKEVESQENE